MWNTMKLVFDTFGPTIFVPVMLFIVALCLKAPVKKAFMSAILAGVGLVGFNMVIGSYSPIITPLIQKLVKETGINLPVIDMGWQALAAVAYSTEIGMMFIGVGLLFQLILFLVKWTPIFMPSDLWNNYSFIVWGSMIYFTTKSVYLAFGCMIFSNLVILLFSEIIQKRWSTYYNYPNCAMTAPHHIGHVPFSILIDVILNKIGADRINLRPETIQGRLGFLGEPMTIGFIVGSLIGVVSDFKHLGELAAWGDIAKVGITTAAVMAIFPKVAGIFAAAFTAINDASKKSIKSSAKSRQWYMAVNDALGYGESATLVTGLLLIPFALVLAFILPGNMVIPILVLTGLPYMSEVNICLSNGNIFKAVIAGAIIFTAQLYMATANAVVFTEIAKSVGVNIPSAAVMVIGFVASNITMGLIYQAFLKQNPLVIGGMVVAYFLLYFWYKRNKPMVDDFLETNAVSYQTKMADAENSVIGG